MVTESVAVFHTTPVRGEAGCCLPMLENTLVSFQEFEKSLECKLCFKMLSDPVLFGKCEHSFCRNCILTQVGKACPLCCTPGDVKDAQDDYHLSVLVSLSHQLRSLLTTNEALTFCNNERDKNAIEYVTMSDQDNLSACAEQENSITDMHEKNINVKLGISDDQNTEADLNISAVFEAKGESIDAVAVQNTDSVSCTPENCGTRQKMLICDVSKDKMNLSSKPCPRERGDPLTPVTSKGRSSFTPSSSRCRTKKSSITKKKGFSSPAHRMKRNAKGETPLHIAAIKGDVAVVRGLLKNGVSPNVKDNAGWTPLHEACNHGHKEIAELLLDNGALINIPGCENETPLHDAVLNNRIEVVKLLVAAGADLNVRNSRGFTPLQIQQTEEMRAALLQTTPASLIASPSINVKETVSSKAKITVVASGLDNAQKSLLQKCATMLKATIHHDFSPEVTHVVTVCDDNGNCPRTLKFLYGVISAKWIVNFHWVELCLEYKQKIPEEVFEVQGTTQQPDSKGPMRARINAENQFPPLFDGCKFYFIGNFMPPAPPRGLLMILVRMGGGVILSREPRPSLIASEPCIVPYHITSGSPLADVSHFIVYQGPSPRNFTTEGPVCCVPVFWLLDSISAFKLQPLPTE